MLKVLVLASWYPNKTDAFAGDFIQRHVLATSAYAKCVVLFITKDESLGKREEKIEVSNEDGVIVYRAYYGRSSNISILEKFRSLRTYIALQEKLIQKIQKDHGIPDIVHVQVTMKAGLGAIYFKKQLQIPYVVTEHWSGYYRESVPNIYQQSSMFRKFTRQILSGANLLLPVTNDLGRLIANSFTKTPYQAVPNVVNTDLFFYKEYRPSTFRFIHPSYLNYQKNPEGMLNAAAQLKKQGYQFELILLGNDNEKLKQLASELDLSNEVSILAPVSYPEVAQYMQQSSALLLFSRFENIPCVVLEALCCGLPVISTRVGGIAEFINEENGLLIQSEDVNALTAAMKNMIDNYEQYNRSNISINAINNYSYPVVGKQYFEIYKKIIKETQFKS